MVFVLSNIFINENVYKYLNLHTTDLKKIINKRKLKHIYIYACTHSFLSKLKLVKELLSWLYKYSIQNYESLYFCLKRKSNYLIIV